MDRVVVTGATGLIGLAIIEAILSKSKATEIYAVVRHNSNKLSRLPKDSRVHVVKCDVSQYESLKELIGITCDVFYHAAWTATGLNRNEDILDQCKNIEYTLKAVRAASQLGCKKFIGTGSQAEYGLLDLPKISPNSPINPIQPYGIAKYAAGKLAAEAAKQVGLNFIWVRIFSVYGKYDQPTTMISSTIKKLQNGEKTSFTPATQLWDYLYSSDAGEAFYLIGKKSIGNKVYCLGSGIAKPLYQYIEELRDVVAPGVELGIGEIPFNYGMVMNLCADISEITEDTGWIPRIDFKTGIQKIVKNEK